MTRAELRQAIRGKLKDHPRLINLTAGVNPDSTTFTLPTAAAAERIKADSQISIGTEICGVVSSSGADLIVDRGIMGTTAQSWDAGSSIHFGAEWTDIELNRLINQALLAETSPKFYCIYNSEYTVTGSQNWIDLAPEAIKIISVYRKTSSDTHPGHGKRVHYFHLEKTHQAETSPFPLITRIIFPWLLETTDIIYVSYTFTPPAVEDDTDEIGYHPIPDEATGPRTEPPYETLSEFLVYAVAKKALEERISPRAEYTKYSATLNERASDPDAHIRSAMFFGNQAEIIKAKAPTPPGGYLPIPIRGFPPGTFRGA